MMPDPTTGSEVRRLGRSALRVSPYCLGTTNFGVHTDEPTSHQILSEALEAGIYFIDTADAYGYAKGRGRTEEIIGRWLAEDPGRRERIVLATKVYSEMSSDPNDRGLSAFHIKRACEASLRRLQTDHIDLYQLHHVDRDAPWQEVWQALEQLIREGKITYVGTSNHAGWHIARACESAAARHLLGPISEQSVYNLLQRQVELEVLPACAHYGLGLVPYSPLCGGALAGAIAQPEGARRETSGRQQWIEKHREALSSFEALCADLGQRPADVALCWVRQQPGVAAPIIGPRTPEQLAGNLRALELRLDEATLTRLDEIFPGPGGPAPEAYAW
jgi:aryl-alcohol dehydrogenase-like predicted oxidoreductase